MASSGIGSPAHVAGELFAMMTGVKFTHVPYRGDAPAIADLIGGQVQLYFGFLPASLQHVEAGRLRALGVSTASRIDTLPEIPSIGETVRGYEATSWNGVGAPAGTPAPIIATLDRQINAALADSDVKRRLVSLGAIVDGCSAPEFKIFISKEVRKWADVVHFAGIKA
jgi:tripartite-type tricarboxylate transporter receptor subunit TctC